MFQCTLLWTYIPHSRQPLDDGKPLGPNVTHVNASQCSVPRGAACVYSGGTTYPDRSQSLRYYWDRRVGLRYRLLDHHSRIHGPKGVGQCKCDITQCKSMLIGRDIELLLHPVGELVLALQIFGGKLEIETWFRNRLCKWGRCMNRRPWGRFRRGKLRGSHGRRRDH